MLLFNPWLALPEASCCTSVTNGKEYIECSHHLCGHGSCSARFKPAVGIIYNFPAGFSRDGELKSPHGRGIDLSDLQLDELYCWFNGCEQYLYVWTIHSFGHVLLVFGRHCVQNKTNNGL